MNTQALPTDAAARKDIPIVRGLLDYFPAALAAVAELSRIGNEQHNPGEEMHWARGKSNDHADCAVRHLMDRGTIDSDTVRHSTKAAWRALANLQVELEEAGAPLARGARVAPATAPTRMWNEGWKCPRCGTTELWEEETPMTVAHDVLCATRTCLGYMNRV